MGTLLTRPRPEVQVPDSPDPQVPDKARRRRFTAEYKARIVAEVEACTEPGQIGALLRREGIYSNLAEWRRQAKEEGVTGLERRRGRKPDDPLVAENAKLKKQNGRLARRLEQAEAVIEVQKNSPRSWGFRWAAKTTNRRPDRDDRKVQAESSGENRLRSIGSPTQRRFTGVAIKRHHRRRKRLVRRRHAL